ncbi:TadE/TadG family type IV pilus assembly protein [Paenibacillus silviterrae]|uniref:TadE/TadG family type IV pilus assembly protein n=1 Tax=Paenibacillus silviterrae TaxID=3242194 RepID=UPI002543B5AA|nr:TadE family protein [Paenibacillus chinjuensis]
MQKRQAEEGSMVVEAALVMPFFLTLIMLLVSFIQISLAEMALQTAVSESSKVIASNMYPVRHLYLQGQARWQQSAAGVWLEQIVSQVQTARQTVTDAEAFADDYAQWIPEPLLMAVKWEKERREKLETLGQDAAQTVKDRVNEGLRDAATPIVAAFADERRLRREKLKVTKLVFPSFENMGEAYLVIEAQYELTLHIPFYRKTILLKKQAMERAWIGGDG